MAALSSGCPSTVRARRAVATPEPRAPAHQSRAGSRRPRARPRGPGAAARSTALRALIRSESPTCVVVERLNHRLRADPRPPPRPSLSRGRVWSRSGYDADAARRSPARHFGRRLSRLAASSTPRPHRPRRPETREACRLRRLHAARCRADVRLGRCAGGGCLRVPAVPGRRTHLPGARARSRGCSSRVAGGRMAAPTRSCRAIPLVRVARLEPHEAPVDRCDRAGETW